MSVSINVNSLIFDNGEDYYNEFPKIQLTSYKNECILIYFTKKR